MKNTTVYWAPWNHSVETNMAQILFSEPISVLKDIGEIHKGNNFFQCPAVTDYCKNTYAIKSELDIELSYNKDTGWVSSSIPSQAFFDEFVFVEPKMDWVKTVRITLPSRHVFYSDDDIQAELIPAYLQGSRVPENINVVPGTFNISKWIRPLECSGIILDLDKPIKIKKGDVLYYVRFIPKTDSKITLERVALTEDIKQITFACLFVKELKKKLPLSAMYILAEGAMGVFKRNRKPKCPFSRLWKR